MFNFVPPRETTLSAHACLLRTVARNGGELFRVGKSYHVLHKGLARRSCRMQWQRHKIYLSTTSGSWMPKMRHDLIVHTTWCNYRYREGTTRYLRSTMVSVHKRFGVTCLPTRLPALEYLCTGPAIFFASLPLDTLNAGPTRPVSAILPSLTVHATLQPPASFARSLAHSLADAKLRLDPLLLLPLSRIASRFLILHPSGLFRVPCPWKIHNSPDRRLRKKNPEPRWPNCRN
ncbi:hypothetical protein V8C37DRAFT_315529 [Trichoderma ceciliae]